MSGTYSKYFYQIAENRTCGDFLHPGLTCTQALKETFFDGILGSLKFYFPVCVVPLILKVKKWNHVKIWKEFIQDGVKCFCFGLLLNILAFTGVCCSFNFFRRFFLPFLITLPISLSALLSFILPAHVLKVEGQGMFNIYLDFLIRRSRFSFIQKIRNSKVGATIVFSVLQCCIMFGFLKRCTKNFWFSSLRISEKDISEDNNSGGCKKVHGSLSCYQYFKQEMKQTISFAVALASLKVLPKILRSNLSAAPSILAGKIDFGIIMFVLSLNGIFKSIFCLLNQTKRFPIEINCIISSLLSGVSYIFYPRYIIFTMAITNAVESTYNCIRQRLLTTNKKLPMIMKIIDKVPVTYLMFAACTGLNTQLRILHPGSVNKILHKIASQITNGKVDKVSSRLFSAMAGLE